MGYMLSNTASNHYVGAGWSDGEYDIVTSHEFRAEDVDSEAFQEFLEYLTAGGVRAMIATRVTHREHDCDADYAEECTHLDMRESTTEVATMATPLYVANFLFHWGLTPNGNDLEHWYFDGQDSYFDAYGSISADYSVRLIGYRPWELQAIANGVDRANKRQNAR